MGYGFKHSGRTMITKVAKPSANTVDFTFNTQEQGVTINGFDPLTMEKSGIEKATSSGDYSVTFTLKKNCKWTDGTKEPYTISWKIDKRRITIPSVEGSFTFIGGETRYAIIKGIDSDYVNQSGPTSSSSYDPNGYTVTFDLKYKNDTIWTDETETSKSGKWYVVWVDGSSHYANDIYNRGWGIGNLQVSTGTSGGGQINSDNIQINNHSHSGYVIKVIGTFNVGDPINVDIERFGSRGTIHIAECAFGTSGYATNIYETVDAGTRKTLSTTFKKIYMQGSQDYTSSFCWANGGQRIYRIWR